MDLGSGACEIIEVEEVPSRPPKGKEVNESGSTSAMNHGVEKRTVLQGGSCGSVEDDINLLFDAIRLKVSRKIMSQSQDDGLNSLKKSAMKKPIRMGVSYSPGSEISEQAGLKQALRGLCISQASEMAAMKRLSKSVASSPRISEAGRIKSLFKAKVVEAGESSKSKGSTDSIGESVSSKFEGSPQFHQELTTQSTKKSFVSSPRVIMNDIRKQTGTSPTPDETYPLSPEFGKRTPKEEITEASDEGSDVKVPTSTKKTKKESSAKTGLQPKSQNVPLPSGSITAKRPNKSNRKPPIVVKSVLKNKIASTKKLRHEASSAAKSHLKSDINDVSNCQLVCQRCQCTLQLDDKTQSPEYFDVEVDIKDAPSRSLDEARKQGVSHTGSMKDTAVEVVANKNAKSGEKCEFSNSSKSSLGEFSSATSISDDSNPSRLSCSNRPHMARDVRWLAIRHVKCQSGALGLKNFNLLKKLGCGDIGTVYLAELIGTNCPFAIKVMDNEYLARRKKLPRAQAEREILRMLDHPFLPTLYAQFTSENLSCLVMEYCPGGDLHVLRQKQLGRSFPEQSARFYVAEVLLALEYLHMLGVVYRDLKPENILVREDGHIMLTDFDLSLRCDVNPVLLQPSYSMEPSRISGPCRGKSCIDPFCIDPTCKVSCFSPRVHSKARNRKPDPAVRARSLLQLVAEPTEARSNSFVGTHEYLAPEIIKGEGHGSAVDWWTLGVFLYELLYGKTPFKGAGNDETLTNVVLQSLKFPDTPLVSFQARDLIKALLMKEPDNRLGSERGAAEIKRHPFFEGLNWALIRCAPPPELPESYDYHYQVPDPASERKSNYLEYNVSDEQLEFEFF